MYGLYVQGQRICTYIKSIEKSIQIPTKSQAYENADPEGGHSPV